MRQFVVLGHEVPLEPDFSLDDLAGGAGRLDVVCRCVNAAVFLSHGIREDVRVSVVLQDTVTIEIASGHLRYMAPDERNIAGLLRNTLEAKHDAIGHQAVEASPGVKIANRDLTTTLERIETPLYLLHESGDPLPDVQPPEEAGYIVSDHLEFTERDRSVMEDRVVNTLSLSPRRLHADHAITIVHNYHDTDGYTRYSTTT